MDKNVLSLKKDGMQYWAHELISSQIQPCKSL